MTDIIIQASNVSKIYKTLVDEITVFENISVKIKRGEAVALVGKSGGGKTTLLNILSGLDHPSAGDVLFDNKPINTMDETQLAIFRNKHVGFIFQHHYLLDDFTAIENIMIPLRIAAVKFDQTVGHQIALSLLRTVGIANRADHYPDQLSGGERQRVAVARALVNNPDVIFADEPTGSLDIKNATIVENLLWELKDKYNKTLVMATHSLATAKRCDKIIRME